MTAKRSSRSIDCSQGLTVQLLTMWLDNVGCLVVTPTCDYTGRNEPPWPKTSQKTIARASRDLIQRSVLPKNKQLGSRAGCS